MQPILHGHWCLLIGYLSGKVIQKLTRVSLGCVSSFKTWIFIVSLAAPVVIIVLVIVLSKKCREIVRYQLFMRFDILTNNDEGEENIQNMKYDVFITYRLVLHFKALFTKCYN